jgi:hypothetical protein
MRSPSADAGGVSADVQMPFGARTDASSSRCSFFCDEIVGDEYRLLVTAAPPLELRCSE